MKNGDETESVEMVNNATTPNEHLDPTQNNYLDNSHQAGETVQAGVAPDHQSVSLSNIYNDVLNGQIRYSTDPEGKDMPTGRSNNNVIPAFSFCCRLQVVHCI